jgi:hypothetical protein
MRLHSEREHALHGPKSGCKEDDSTPHREYRGGSRDCPFVLRDVLSVWLPIPAAQGRKASPEKLNHEYEDQDAERQQDVKPSGPDQRCAPDDPKAPATSACSLAQTAQPPPDYTGCGGNEQDSQERVVEVAPNPWEVPTEQELQDCRHDKPTDGRDERRLVSSRGRLNTLCLGT